MNGKLYTINQHIQKHICINLLLNPILSVIQTDPTLLAKQGNLHLADWDHVQMTSRYLQEWTLHNVTEQPVPVLSDPHKGWGQKKSFFIFTANLHCYFSLHSASGPATGNP